MEKKEKKTVDNDDGKKLAFLLRAFELVGTFGFDGEDFDNMLLDLFMVIDEDVLFENIACDSLVGEELPRKKLIAVTAGFLSLLSCDEAYAAIRYSREEWWDEPVDEDVGTTDRDELLKLIQENKRIPAKNRFRLSKRRY